MPEFDCSLKPNSKNFNDNTMEELYKYYNTLTDNDEKNTFNECLINYNNNDINSVDNIEEKLNEFKYFLDKTNNAKSINDNTISLYNDDFFYTIFKISLFLILGIVYVVLIKNTNIISTIDKIKTKTLKISENIKGLTNTKPIQSTIVKPIQQVI
jgi:GMP synthase PP-ATPase subunit